MPVEKDPRLYSRARMPGTPVRYDGDFRDYKDVGGSQEALVADGQRFATDDYDVARSLCADRVRFYEELRRTKDLTGMKPLLGLEEIAAKHLVKFKAEGNTTEEWLEQIEIHCAAAVRYFGAERRLDTISIEDCENYLLHLAKLKTKGNRNGNEPTRLKGGTRRKYVNSMNKLFRRAAGWGQVRKGYNPFPDLMGKPSDDEHDAEWHELNVAALVIDAARSGTIRATRTTRRRPRDDSSWLGLEGGGPMLRNPIIIHRGDCSAVTVGDRVIRVLAGRPMWLTVKRVDRTSATFELEVPGHPHEQGWLFGFDGLEIDPRLPAGMVLSYIGEIVEGPGVGEVR